MLVTGVKLLGVPIMSLQTGTKLAQTTAAIVNPANLKIVAYELEGILLTSHPTFVRIADVRELSNIGMIVDSQDELVTAGDVIAIDKLYDLHFHLENMPVIDEDRHKLGKIEGYILETEGFVIQQLNVKRGFLKGFSEPNLLIYRSQIVEINDTAIIVKSTKESSPKLIAQTIKKAYANPFRGQQTAPRADSSRPLAIE